MIIVLSGLPPPGVQVPLLDDDQRVVARPDLAYPWARLGIEYDGATHRDSLAEDNRRQNLLLKRLGVVLLRYTASDVYNNSATIINDVRSMLQPHRSPANRRFEAAPITDGRRTVGLGERWVWAIGDQRPVPAWWAAAPGAKLAASP